MRGSDWRLRGSDWRLRCAFFLALLCTASSAFAARPFVTDDARIVDPGGCQVESFHKSQRKLQETEFWFLPGCNLFGRFELTTGGIWVGSDTPGDSRTTVMQLKTLLKPLETNGSGYALTLGVNHATPYRASQTVSPFVNGIGSFSFANDRVVVHANLGALEDRQARMLRGTWGLGAEIATTSRVYGIVESYGQRGEKPTLQLGLRIWLVPNKVQIDGTLGAQHSGPPERAFRSIGVRLLF